MDRFAKFGITAVFLLFLFACIAGLASLGFLAHGCGEIIKQLPTPGPTITPAFTGSIRGQLAPDPRPFQLQM